MDNSLPNPQLDQRKHQVEARLRQDYAGFAHQDYLSIHVMAAYHRYYRRFEKT